MKLTVRMCMLTTIAAAVAPNKNAIYTTNHEYDSNRQKIFPKSLLLSAHSAQKLTRENSDFEIPMLTLFIQLFISNVYLLAAAINDRLGLYTKSWMIFFSSCVD